MGQSNESLVYTVSEVARMLRVSLSVAYECIHTNIIPHLMLGKKRIVIPKVAFHKWLEQSPWAKMITKDNYAYIVAKTRQDSIEPAALS